METLIKKDTQQLRKELQNGTGEDLKTPARHYRAFAARNRRDDGGYAFADGNRQTSARSAAAGF